METVNGKKQMVGQKTINSKNQRNGFTLVELLVVISIISLLMSIMLPGLSNARELAKRVVCLSNLRHFHLIWLMYSQDNDDRLCSPDTLWTTDDHGIPIPEEDKGAHWVAEGPVFNGNKIGGTEQALEEGVLWQYGATTKLYKCKSDSSEMLRSFSIPISMGGKNLPTGYGRAFGSQGITRNSEKILFMDAEIDPGWNADWPLNKFWLNGPFKLSMSGSNPIWGQTNGQQIALRHNNGSNFVFGDGHGGYRKWKDPRTIDFHEGIIDSATASSNNEDLEWLFDAIKGD